jgi:CRISPR-associated protein (TIGR03985 family)
MQLKPPSLKVLLELSMVKDAAVRTYAIIQALYGVDALTVGNKLSAIQGVGFTSNEFLKKFFNEGCYFHKQGKGIRDNPPSAEQLKHDPTCRCNKRQWKIDFQKKYPKTEIEKFLKQKPFQCAPKTVENRLDDLCKKGYLQKQVDKNDSNKSEKSFQRVVEISLLQEILETNSESNTDNTEIVTEFIPDAKIGLVHAINLLGKPIRGIQRFYQDTDYIVHVDVDEEEIYEVLSSAWLEEKTSLVKFSYHSASKGNKHDCVVYPVICIYPTRAVYLAAIGMNPDGKLGWYIYRIDRIHNIVEVAHQDMTDEQRKLYDFPNNTPEYVIEQLNNVYGSDFYQEPKEMLLRFDRDFYINYLENTDREKFFSPMGKGGGYKEARQLLVNQEVSDRLPYLEKNCQKDIYCLVKYRTKDNSVIMRLRSWGQDVEVLYPKELRKRMTDDMRETWESYSAERNV